MKLFNEMETFLDTRTGIIYKRPFEIENGSSVAVISRDNTVVETGFVMSFGIDRAIINVGDPHCTPISRLISQLAVEL